MPPQWDQRNKAPLTSKGVQATHLTHHWRKKRDWDTMVSMNPFLLCIPGNLVSMMVGVKEVPLKIGQVHVYLLICLFFY